MNIDNEFDIGDMVYLRNDKDQSVRFITGIMVREGGRLIYEVSFMGNDTDCYEFELSKERDIVMATTN